MYDNAVTGYTPIHIDWNGSSSSVYFNGLSFMPSHSSCYCKSYCGTSSNWWFALFSYSSYEGGVPGPEWGSSSYKIVTKIRLWLRVK